MSNETALLNSQLPIPAEAVLTVSPHLSDHTFFRDVLRNWRCFGTKTRREVLRLSPGDYVELDVNSSGEIVVRKVARALPARSARRGARPVHPRVEEQMRCRAEELLALLRGLD